jgi:hypothetical protein
MKMHVRRISPAVVVVTTTASTVVLALLRVLVFPQGMSYLAVANVMGAITLVGLVVFQWKGCALQRKMPWLTPDLVTEVLIGLATSAAVHFVASAILHR